MRAFFSQYGTIVEVSMRPYKHLAIVKYDSWNAANAAYRSPKVIFDNRFVKVFWYKDADEEPTSTKNGGAPPASAVREGSASASAATEQATPEVDMEDFLRRQEEAQRAFEEKRQKAAEIERQREELERKQKELLAKQQAERQRLYARIAALSAGKEEGPSPPADAGAGTGTGTEKKPSQSEALRAQLAALEAEAKQLGIDPEAGGEEEQPWSGFSYRGAYRGRGRGGFVPRGRGGYVPRAGGYRGRGGGVGRGGGGHAAYAAYSIDNRPKKVAVSGVDFTDEEKGEKLRQYLFVSARLSFSIEIDYRIPANWVYAGYRRVHRHPRDSVRHDNRVQGQEDGGEVLLRPAQQADTGDRGPGRAQLGRGAGLGSVHDRRQFSGRECRGNRRTEDGSGRRCGAEGPALRRSR